MLIFQWFDNPNWPKSISLGHVGTGGSSHTPELILGPWANRTYGYGTALSPWHALCRRRWPCHRSAALQLPPEVRLGTSLKSWRAGEWYTVWLPWNMVKHSWNWDFVWFFSKRWVGGWFFSDWGNIPSDAWTLCCRANSAMIDQSAWNSIGIRIMQEVRKKQPH